MVAEAGATVVRDVDRPSIVLGLVHDLVYHGCLANIGAEETLSMVAEVNVHEAKTHLSRLLQRVEQGEEIVIARAGKPIARLVPIAPPPASRVPGLFAGQIWIAEDFDEGLSDWLADLFEGGDDVDPD